MENALFYTFSTIAQTLAASIALLGAFVLYRLQTLNAEIEDAGLTMIQPYLPNDEATRLVAHGRYAELISLLTQIQPNSVHDANNPFITSKRDKLPHLLALRTQLHRLLKFALGSTVVVIVSAIVILAITPVIASSSNLVWLTFSIGLLALLGCLCLYAVLILKAVQNG